jgi:tRNA G37 N-methylase Trm5
VVYVHHSHADLNPASFKYLEVNARNNHCNPRHLRCYNMDGRYCLVQVTLRFVYSALCSAAQCSALWNGCGVSCTAFGTAFSYMLVLCN